MRVKEKIENIDYNETKEFFKNRAGKFKTDNPYAVTMYQDHNEKLVRERNKKEVQKLKPLLELSEQSRILDVGCGIGRWGDAISEKIEEYCPKDLAKAYLGDLLAKENGFSWNRFLTVCAFYSLVGFSGLFVIPVLVIVAPTFILCGVASAVLGIIKLVDYLLHLNIPYVDYIGFQFGNIALSPIPVFILSLITGIILFLLGRGAWKLLITYCKGISKTKNNLSI